MVMNQKQKKLSKIISIIIGLIVAFPPYVTFYEGNVISSGFSFIFDLPSSSTVNVSMLFAEMLGALVIGVILFYVAKENNE